MKKHFQDMIVFLYTNLDNHFIEQISTKVCHGISSIKKAQLKELWISFFKELIKGFVKNKMYFLPEKPVYYENELKEDEKTRHPDISHSEFIGLYKDRAMRLLEETKRNASNAGVEMIHEDLVTLQKELEALTIYFDEEDMFSSAPILMRHLRNGNKCSAKEYLMGKFQFDRLTENDNVFVRVTADSSVDSGKKPLSKNKSQLVKKYDLLTGEEKELLSHFGHQTLEALLVHILSCLYNYENSVSVIHLIERIENRVRRYGHMLKDRKPAKGSGKESVDFPASTLIDEIPVPELVNRKKGGVRYPFGVGLLEFLIERGFITLVTTSSGEVHKKEKKSEGKSKAQSYYSMKSLHAKCSFDPMILPIHMNLPMVAPPVDWKISPKAEGNDWLGVSDLEGGYYCSSNALERHELFSSLDKENLTIFFGLNNEKGKEKAESFCSIMNKLQKQPQINSRFLRHLRENELSYVLHGFLYPSFFEHIDLNIKGPKYETMESDAIKLLRRLYNANIQENMQICSFNEMFRVLEVLVAEARYEQTILRLAEAYDGYKFYLPAFLDFRGRIYRSGILHFHERPLARSLLMLGSDKSMEKANSLLFKAMNSNINTQQKRLKVSTANHYGSFSNDYEAITWFENMYLLIMNRTEEEMEKFEKEYPNSSDNTITSTRNNIILNILLAGAQDAKEPLLFLSKMITVFLSDRVDDLDVLKSVAVSQDASASASQIMSFFLLDTKMGEKTNLISSPTDNKEDIYTCFQEELFSYLALEYKKSGNEEIFDSIKGIFDRNFVKRIFMPMIYGKTPMSTCEDIRYDVKQFIKGPACMKLTNLCFEFWKLNRWNRSLVSFSLTPSGRERNLDYYQYQVLPVPYQGIEHSLKCGEPYLERKIPHCTLSISVFVIGYMTSTYEYNTATSFRTGDHTSLLKRERSFLNATSPLYKMI